MVSLNQKSSIPIAWAWAAGIALVSVVAFASNISSKVEAHEEKIKIHDEIQQDYMDHIIKIHQETSGIRTEIAEMKGELRRIRR